MTTSYAYLVSFAETLGRRDLVTLGAAHGVIWVLLSQQAEESSEQQVVVDRAGLVVLPDTGALLHIT